MNMATHKLIVRQIIITLLLLLLHCWRCLFFALFFLYFSLVSFLIHRSIFLMLQLLPWSCSQQHIPNKEIFRRWLSIEAFPLSSSIPLPLSSFSLSLFNFLFRCARSSCSKSICINTTRFIASNSYTKWLCFFVDIHSVFTFFLFFPFYRLESASLRLNRERIKNCELDAHTV
jgi:hypothetical protein